MKKRMKLTYSTLATLKGLYTKGPPWRSLQVPASVSLAIVCFLLRPMLGGRSRWIMKLPSSKWTVLLFLFLYSLFSFSFSRILAPSFIVAACIIQPRLVSTIGLSPSSSSSLSPSCPCNSDSSPCASYSDIRNATVAMQIYVADRESNYSPSATGSHLLLFPFSSQPLKVNCPFPLATLTKYEKARQGK